MSQIRVGNDELQDWTSKHGRDQDDTTPSVRAGMKGWAIIRSLSPYRPQPSLETVKDGQYHLHTNRDRLIGWSCSGDRDPERENIPGGKLTCRALYQGEGGGFYRTREDIRVFDRADIAIGFMVSAMVVGPAGHAISYPLLGAFMAVPGAVVMGLLFMAGMFFYNHNIEQSFDLLGREPFAETILKTAASCDTLTDYGTKLIHEILRQSPEGARRTHGDCILYDGEDGHYLYHRSDSKLRHFQNKDDLVECIADQYGGSTLKAALPDTEPY